MISASPGDPRVSENKACCDRENGLFPRLDRGDVGEGSGSACTYTDRWVWDETLGKVGIFQATFLARDEVLIDLQYYWWPWGAVLSKSAQTWVNVEE